MSVKAVEMNAGVTAGEPSALVRWYALLCMCLVYTISIADRYVISTVLEPIRLELHLSDSGVAFLTGVSLSLFYVSFGIPLSLLVDRFNRCRIIAICMAAWSALTVLCGLATSYTQLLLGRIGVGIGEAGGTPAANSILSDYFPAERRPMALTVFALGAPIGAFVGYQLAGHIADAYGWRAVFRALGVPGILFGALIYLTVREPRRGALDIVAEDKPSMLETLRFLWKQRAACHVMMGTSVTALWGWGLTWWTPTFLTRCYGLTLGQAGDITGPAHLYGGIVSTVATAWLLGRPFMYDPRRVVIFLGSGIAFGTIPSIVIFWTHSLELTRIMFWLFIPFIYFYIGPGFGILNNLSPPRMRGQFCAIVLLLANVGNLIIAPQLVGFISDFIAAHHVDNGQSLRMALLCLAPTGFWSAWHMFRSVRTLREEQERAIGPAS